MASDSGARSSAMDEVIAALRDNDGFVIAGHRDPDGDSLGSSLALGLALERSGKRVAVISADPLSAAYRRLPESGRIEVRDTAPEGFPVAVLIECNGVERSGVDGLDDRLVINIDHHANNPGFGDVNWVDPGVAATGVMIYDLLRAMELQISPEIATHLYVAILTDTGSFRYSNTDARALRVAAELVELGVDPAAVAEAIYENVPAAKVRLLGAALASLELLAGGAVAVMVLPYDVLHAGPGEADTEGIVNHGQGIDGVAVAALFKEVGRDQYRVSLRSRGDVDVAAIAASFGGGGHPRAAGCTLEGSLESARNRVLEPVLRELEAAGPIREPSA